MEEDQFLWDHFKFNAEQRLKGFNLFVLLSIFADGGILTAIEKGLLTILGIFTIVLATVFWLVDARSEQLLKLTIPALKELENNFKPKSKLFALDSEKQRKFIRYTFAIRTLLVCQLLFGIGVLGHGLYTWLR